MQLPEHHRRRDMFNIRDDHYTLRPLCIGKVVVDLMESRIIAQRYQEALKGVKVQHGIRNPASCRSRDLLGCTGYCAQHEGLRTLQVRVLPRRIDVDELIESKLLSVDRRHAPSLWGRKVAFCFADGHSEATEHLLRLFIITLS